MSIFKKPIVLGYLAILGISQLVVILFEATNFEFPTHDYFLGQPYNPWSGFWKDSLITAIIMILFGLFFVWLPHWNRIKNKKFRIIIVSVSTIFLIFTVWLMLGLSVQSILLTYLNSINANPLHFLGRLDFSGFLTSLLFDFLSSKSYLFYIIIGSIETIMTLIIAIQLGKQIELTKSTGGTL